MKYLLMAAGGAAGTLLRYFLVHSLQTRNENQFPSGTFAVNLIGSFVIGLIAGMFINRNLSEEWRLFLFVGLLGGFTTFSSLAFETFNLIKAGNVMTAIFYMTITNIAGLMLAVTGFYFAKRLSVY
jgi:CrcB protein